MWLAKYLNKCVLRKSIDESKLYLRKVDHNFNLANWLFRKHEDDIPEAFGEETFYDWVISMYYYAVYHATLALISREGYKSKNHSASLCFLIYHHYHLQKGLSEEDVELIASSLDREDIEIIGSAKEMREKASYDVHETFQKQLADNLRRQASSFSNKIKSLLE